MGEAAAPALTAALSTALTEALTSERLRIVANLIRVTRDWELAEDCVQDAAERALARWPTDGIPDNPAAWLTTTARRRALDVLRRRHVEAEKLHEIEALAPSQASPAEPEDPGPYGDDRLRLLFACCHPALPLAGRVALTLKTVAGLSTREIARAFLVSEATMSQRLLRTRTKIEHSGIGFRIPEPHRLRDRVGAVLAVIYLLFNEGYAATEGPYLRDELAEEAIRLADLLASLLPDDDEVLGLRALLLLQHSRSAARMSAAGDLLTMEEQDRGLWDREQIAAGLASLAAARSTGRPQGFYRLQAEIAALHATAATPEATDWARIVVGYDALLEHRASPVVALNRAAAIGFRDGPEAGLAALDAGIADSPLVPAVRADLFRRSGRFAEAAAAYHEAIARAGTDAERRQLQRRLDELTNLS
ncbi:MAG TPA: sigma-70 family RNA polymerase sigma factor [Candidatus Limnocylindrales bacterium]